MRSLVILLAVASPAFANVGAPTWGGQRTGEPAGITGVAIAREDLVIDLRPIAQRELATVSATYQLDNRGDAVQLDLVFASGARELVDFRVTLDGASIPARLDWGGELPASWRAPPATPLPDGGELSFDVRDLRDGTASFKLSIPPGAHTLAITYRADTMRHHAGGPMLFHQLAYVLSPARTWAGFGGLALTIHVPPGWLAAVTPSLARDGDTFAGTFSTIPADAVAITLHAPPGAHRILRIVGIVLLGLALIGGGIGVHKLAFARGRRRAAWGRLPANGAVALGLAIAWSASIIAAGWFAIFGPDLALPLGQADHRGYGAAFAFISIFLLALILFVIGIVLGVSAGRSGYDADADRARDNSTRI